MTPFLSSLSALPASLLARMTTFLWVFLALVVFDALITAFMLRRYAGRAVEDNPMGWLQKAMMAVGVVPALAISHLGVFLVFLFLQPQPWWSCAAGLGYFGYAAVTNVRVWRRLSARA